MMILSKGCSEYETSFLENGLILSIDVHWFPRRIRFKSIIWAKRHHAFLLCWIFQGLSLVLLPNHFPGLSEITTALRSFSELQICVIILHSKDPFRMLSLLFILLFPLQLLDCFVIPVVILLSWFFLLVRYKAVHFIGIVVCILGMGCMAGTDVLVGRQQGAGTFLQIGRKCGFYCCY